MVHLLGAANRFRADGGIDLHVLVTCYCDSHLGSWSSDLVFLGMGGVAYQRCPAVMSLDYLMSCNSNMFSREISNDYSCVAQVWG